MLLQTSFSLPLLEWVKIPGGKVPFARGWGTIEVASFAIAKYPTTNAQFQAFIDDKDGYHNAEWWMFSAEAQTWHQRNPSPKHSFFAGSRFPRESVSWYEAAAFCAWLGYKMQLPVRLPTEIEWQRAAQGGDGRRYPYGKRYDIKKFNTSASNIGRTTPVDLYPRGRSPFGVYDMSGNVWEWCLNKYASPKDSNYAGCDPRTVRGGSWEDSLWAALAAFRTYSYPAYRLTSVGFRAALSVPLK